MKTVFKIICYVVAAFFVYMVACLGFISLPKMGIGIKFGMMGTFSVPAAVALAVGLSMSARRWRDAGIVFLSGGGMTLFVVGTMAFYFRQPEFLKMMPPETRDGFKAYAFGFGFIGVVLLAGAVCLALGWRSSPRRAET